VNAGLTGCRRLRRTATMPFWTGCIRSGGLDRPGTAALLPAAGSAAADRVGPTRNGVPTTRTRCGGTRPATGRTCWPGGRPPRV